MKGYIAFIKKEFVENLKNYRFFILFAIFAIFGLSSSGKIHTGDYSRPGSWIRSHRGACRP